MGGLGNGRRGGRSPPLLIGALIACVLVLGFNYWVSSSRNLELQAQLFQMEGAARRAAAERAAVEQKKAAFEEQLRMQGDQIKRMEGSHRIQLDTMQANWKQEKTVLVLNISTSTRTIEIMKAQLFGLEEIQKELQDCQNNRINLSTAMNQCEAQMSALKKECAAKTPEKPPPVSPSSQEKSGPPLSRTGLEEKPGLDDTKKPSVLAPKSSRTGAEPDGTNTKLSALETNEIAKAGEKSDITQQQPPVGVAKQGNDLEVMETHVGKQQSTGNDVVLVEKGDKRVDTPVDTPEDKPEDKPGDEPGDKPEDQPEDQPGDKPEDKPGDQPEDKPGDQPEDKPGDKPGDQPEDQPGDKPGDQRNAAGSEAVKQTQLKANAGRDLAVGHALSDRKDKLADYNGDADNEGEFEADKQAELAKH